MLNHYNLTAMIKDTVMYWQMKIVNLYYYEVKNLAEGILWYEPNPAIATTAITKKTRMIGLAVSETILYV